MIKLVNDFEDFMGRFVGDKVMLRLMCWFMFV